MLFREAYKIGTISGVGAPMVHRRQTAICANHQAGRVVLLLAAVELSPLQHLLNQLRPSHARMVEVLIPQLKVLDGGVQTGGSGSVEVGEVHAEGLARPVLL